MCELKKGCCHQSGGGLIQILILRLLHEKPDYGYVIMQRLQDFTENRYLPESGTVYTLLRRMEKNGVLISDWDTDSSNVDRRIYKLTPFGEQKLISELQMIKARRPVLDSLIDYFDLHLTTKTKNSSE